MRFKSKTKLAVHFSPATPQFHELHLRSPPPLCLPSRYSLCIREWMFTRCVYWTRFGRRSNENRRSSSTFLLLVGTPNLPTPPYYTLDVHATGRVHRSRKYAQTSSSLSAVHPFGSLFVLNRKCPFIPCSRTQDPISRVAPTSHHTHSPFIWISRFNQNPLATGVMVSSSKMKRKQIQWILYG